MIEEISKTGLIIPSFMLELLVAIICGGLIGLYRGLNQKSIGLRDTILVCLGSTLYMNLYELISIGSDQNISGNPGQFASQVIIGISLIGAAIIMKSKSERSGIMIAVTLWVVAAIGLIIGANQWLLGLMVTGITLFILSTLKGIEKSISGSPRQMLLKLSVKEDTEELRKKLKILFEGSGVQVKSFRSEQGPVAVKLTITGSEEPSDIGLLIGKIWLMKNVINVEH